MTASGLDAVEVAPLMGCSADLVREKGDEWGIALVLSRDSNGRATRVVYPRARIKKFLSGSNGRR